jgi:hypothetical protein
MGKSTIYLNAETILKIQLSYRGEREPRKDRDRAKNKILHFIYANLKIKVSQFPRELIMKNLCKFMFIFYLVVQRKFLTK